MAPIPEERDFLSVLKDLAQAVKKADLGKHRDLKLKLYLGEIGDPRISDKIDILEHLKKKGVLHRYSFVRSTEDILIPGEDSLDTVDFETMVCIVSRLRLLRTLQEYSLWPLLSLSYDEKSRHVLINGKTLTKLTFGSVNDEFLSYLMGNSGRMVRISEMKKHNVPLKNRRPHQIIQDLIRKDKIRFPELRHLFFPNVSNAAVTFRNVIYKKDLEKSVISKKKLESELSQLRKMKR